MTNEQAIRILRNMAFLSGDEDAEKTEEAIDMAIEALSCSEKPNNSDLISRQMAIDAIIDLTNTGSVEELREYVNRHGLTKMWSDGVLESVDAVACLPPAQPEIPEWAQTVERLYNKALTTRGIDRPLQWALYHAWKESVYYDERFNQQKSGD